VIKSFIHEYTHKLMLEDFRRERSMPLLYHVLEIVHDITKPF
jgi:hypothetical protein